MPQDAWPEHTGHGENPQMKTIVQSATIRDTTAISAEVEIEVGTQTGGDGPGGPPDEDAAAATRAALAAIGLDRAFEWKTRVSIRPAHAGNGDLHELPIALGLLKLHGRIAPDALDGSIVAGAVHGNGELPASRGMYAVAQLAGPSHLITAEANEPELLHAGVTDATLAGTIRQMAELLGGEPAAGPGAAQEQPRRYTDGFTGIVGWEADKTAMEIAVAGRHPLLVGGSRACPAVGLMRRAATLWPAPEGAELNDIRNMYSLAGLRLEEWAGRNQRPVRAPHFSCTSEAITGRNARRSTADGPGRAQPGEAGLAHGGILIVTDLDEWDEEQLRAIAESAGHPAAGGDRGTPSRYLLMARATPAGDEDAPVRRAPTASGPLGGLLQMRWRMEGRSAGKHETPRAGNETRRRHRVLVATRRQRWRYQDEACNGEVDDAVFAARVDPHDKLRRTLETLGVSPCGPTARIAATIADLRGDQGPDEKDLAEALAYSTEQRGNAQA